jgi:hypothetical protein
VSISLVRICLQRRETIHPAAKNVAKRHLGTPRRDTTDVVGKELLLFRCASGKEAENVVAMDLPFVLFIPFGRGGEETNRRIPPASLQLASRTAETFYELVVTVQQGPREQNKYAFPVPVQRYDTLSTFGMYNRPETKIATADNIVTLGISLPRWSYGPMDPITVYIKIAPNLDWMSKARKVTIQKITLAIEEEITYNHEGDEPTKEINRLHKHVQTVGTRLPEAGYVTNMGVIFPHKDLRDSQGVVRRGQPAFPNYEVTSFTTTSTLYKIEFFLTIKVNSLYPRVPRARMLIRGIGLHDFGQRYHAEATDRHLSDGPPGMQGGDGCDRTGRQGCVVGRSTQPHAPREKHCAGQRLRRSENAGSVHGGRPEEAVYRMT